MSKHDNLQNIETINLTLSPLRPDHAESLFKPFSDPELYTYIFWEPPESSEDLRSKFDRICAGPSPDKKEIWLNWVAKDKATGKYSGFYEATIEGPKALLAYYTFKPFQQKGYAKEGVSAVMIFLASKFELERYVLEIDTRNRASIKIAESLGFKWVQTINSAAEFKGHQSHEFRFERDCMPRVNLE